MKKTSIKKTLLFIRNIFFYGCLFFLFSNCGLETYEVIDSPTNIIHKPTYDELDKTQHYFEFWTKEDTSSKYSEVKFLGTDVYYKIYNNYSNSLSERSSLENIASSTNTAGAADRLISTYKYKQLKASNYSGAVLIPATGSNQKVYIRLANYQKSKGVKEYLAKITANDNPIGTDGDTLPLRSFDELTFDFYNYETGNAKDRLPVKEDEDVRLDSSVEEGKWYINLFAVAVARDMTYSNQYSNILYLGTVTVTTDKAENDPS